MCPRLRAEGVLRLVAVLCAQRGLLHRAIAAGDAANVAEALRLLGGAAVDNNPDAVTLAFLKS